MTDAPAFEEARSTVTALQATVLAAIPEGGGSLTEIAAASRLYTSTTRNVLGWLASKGLVVLRDRSWYRSAERPGEPLRIPGRARPRALTQSAWAARGKVLS